MSECRCASLWFDPALPQNVLACDQQIFAKTPHEVYFILWGVLVDTESKTIPPSGYQISNLNGVAFKPSSVGLTVALGNTPGNLQPMLAVTATTNMQRNMAVQVGGQWYTIQPGNRNDGARDELGTPATNEIVIGDPGSDG